MTAKRLGRASDYSLDSLVAFLLPASQLRCQECHAMWVQTCCFDRHESALLCGGNVLYEASLISRGCQPAPIGNFHPRRARLKETAARSQPRLLSVASFGFLFGPARSLRMQASGNERTQNVILVSTRTECALGIMGFTQTGKLLHAAGTVNAYKAGAGRTLDNLRHTTFSHPG